MILYAVTIGTPVQWATAGLVLFVAWRLSRGGAGAAVSELSESNRVLERRVHELGAEVRDLRIENAELKQRTDFAYVMQEHEDRAQARADATLRVLGLIADRLGPK